jgi:hypothetical protein
MWCLVVVVLTAACPRVFAENPNPGVLPIGSSAFGKSYGEWGAAWWSWAIGIPAASNPILDEDGSFADIDQSGKVWFLAGNFGGLTERTVTIPKGKAIFFPIDNFVFWAPDDLPLAEMIAADFFCLDPDTLSDEELIRLAANFGAGAFTCIKDDLTNQQVYSTQLKFTCTIDGRELRDLEAYRAESDAFVLEDTDLLDDLGVPIAEDNLSVSDGYWLMLTPLSPGKHTIRFTTETEHIFFGAGGRDVTYHITVK